jgi:hypothetical protein
MTQDKIAAFLRDRNNVTGKLNQRFFYISVWRSAAFFVYVNDYNLFSDLKFEDSEIFLHAIS